MRTGATILWKALLGTTAFLVLTSLSTVSARETGITGFAGNNGLICTTCHFSALTPPTVTFSGQTYLRTGQTALYQFIISGGNEIAGGLDIAVGNGSLATAQADTQLLNDEITHTFPQLVNADRENVWQIEFTAPLTEEIVTMYGAGNSVNFNGMNTGDRPNSTTLDIDVRDNLVTFENYDVGTAGSGGLVPTIGGLNGPLDGGAVLQIRDGLGGAPGFLWVGIDQGCSVGLGGKFLIDLGQPFSFFFLGLGGSVGVPGDGTLDVPVGDVSSMLGLDLYLQYTALDNGAPAGISFTNGTLLSIQ
jgi:hypothetical protein